MNIQEAKNIRLVDFLAGFGYEPVIQRGNSVWYKSPFRAEKKASFKVDLHKELWYDFGPVSYTHLTLPTILLV